MDCHRLNWTAIESMVADLRRSLDEIGTMQRRLMRLTGTAWSDDHMVQAIVGPRGQLIELDIDPRVYRKPNSSALAASIVATVRAAVDGVLRQSAEMLDQSIPRDAVLGLGAESPMLHIVRRHDADVLKEMSANGG